MIYTDKLKNIYLFKGDSGSLLFKNIPTDKNYTLFFSIVDEESGKIINEISTNTLHLEEIILNIPVSFTDKLKFESGENERIYKYGVKLCNGIEEHTLVPKVDILGDTPIFKNAPDFVLKQKFVEGV